MTQIAVLPDRAVLAVTGADRVGFLQGLVSADVTRAAPGRALWGALLTPQGKWLADFFILAGPDRLLLDTEAAQAPTIAQRLSRYRLRKDVAITPQPLAVVAGWGGPPPPALAPAAVPDPRLAEAGWRLLAEAPPTPTASPEEYDRHRLRLGLPDGSRDMEQDRSVLLEAGFDELHGISWDKGCYMGQELTARTKYRGLVKRRLVPVQVQGPLPAPGTPVLLDGVEVGTMRSGRDDRGLALLRLAAARAPALACGDAVLTPQPAPWMALAPVQLAEGA